MEGRSWTFGERIRIGLLDLERTDQGDKRFSLAHLEVDACWLIAADDGRLACPALLYRPAGPWRFDESVVAERYRRWRDSGGEEAPGVPEMLVNRAARSPRRLAYALSGKPLMAEQRLSQLAAGKASDTDLAALWKSRPWLLQAQLQASVADDPSERAALSAVERYWAARSSTDEFRLTWPSRQSVQRGATPEHGEMLLRDLSVWSSTSNEPLEELAAFASAVYRGERTRRGLQQLHSKGVARRQEEFGEHGLLVPDLEKMHSTPGFGIPPIDLEDEDDRRRARELVRELDAAPHPDDMALVRWIRSERFLQILDLACRFDRNAWSFAPGVGWDDFVGRRHRPFHRVIRFSEDGTRLHAETAIFADLDEARTLLAGSILDVPDARWRTIPAA